MPDQNFHEIQLSGKQLIFLFMCAVVLTVVVFLFGVSVGRQVPPAGVQETTEVVSAAPQADTSQPATPPAAAPAPAASNEVSYADALANAGAEDPTKAAPPPVSDEPAAAPPQKSQPAPPASKTTAAAPKTSAPASAAPKATAPSKTASKAPAASASGSAGWFVQVGAFNANDIATREVTKLKGRGYPASVLTEAPNVPGPRFKVRVGPYERAEADRVRTQLNKEGYPSFLRR